MPVRTVKTTDDLNRLALSRGASASVGGARFNSTSERVVALPKKAEAKPEPKPEPQVAPKPEPALQQVADALGSHTSHMDAMAKSQADMVQAMTQALEKLSTEPAAKKWRLTPKRDARGLLTSIDIEQV